MVVALNIAVDSKAVDRLVAEFPKKVSRAVGKAMNAEKKSMQAAVRAHVASQLKVLKKGFLNNFRVSVNSNSDPLPYMRIYSRRGWSGVHNVGVTIGGKMLIPIDGRVPRQKFAAIVKALMASGNAFFVKSHGKTILMAENISENAKSLNLFKRRFRKSSGIKRLKRGTEIPIAVLVRRVTIAKRLDVEGVVRDRIPALRAAIEKNLCAAFKGPS